MSEGTRRVLAGSGLVYTSDPRHFYLLPAFTPIAAPGPVWSARSAWRRGASRWSASGSCGAARRRHCCASACIPWICVTSFPVATGSMC